MNIKKYTLDFRNIERPSEVHTIIKDCFAFPDYYGRNWSAFWDCMTEIYGPAIHIEIFKGENESIEEQYGKEKQQLRLQAIRNFEKIQALCKNV